MKIKSLVLACLFVILLPDLSTAQTNKGSFLVGGQTNLSFLRIKTSWKDKSGSGTYDTNKQFEFSPQSGYFIFNNLLTGIMLPVTITKHDAYGDNYKSASLEVVPFIQKYFGNSKVRPFIFGAIGFGWGSYSGYSQSNTLYYKSKDNLFTLKAGGGVAMFLNQSVSIDLSLGYSYHSDSITSNTPVTSSGDHTIMDKGFAAEVGFSFYL